MTVPQQTDDCLNLESLSLDELNRTAVSRDEGGDWAVAADGTLQGPHAGHRCHTADRELLSNRFPENA